MKYPLYHIVVTFRNRNDVTFAIEKVFYALPYFLSNCWNSWCLTNSSQTSEREGNPLSWVTMKCDLWFFFSLRKSWKSFYNAWNMIHALHLCIRWNWCCFYGDYELLLNWIFSEILWGVWIFFLSNFSTYFKSKTM